MNQERSFLGTDFNPQYTPSSDEKVLSLLSHILTFVAPILAPLIIYLLKKDESDFVAEHAKESFNFQLTLVLICIGLFITLIGILLLWVVGIYATILVIVASIRANEGRIYKYPFSIKFIK